MIVSLTILCAIADTFSVARMFLVLNDVENGATRYRTLCIPNPGPAMLLVGYRPAKSDIATRYLPSEVR